MNGERSQRSSRYYRIDRHNAVVDIYTNNGGEKVLYRTVHSTVRVLVLLFEVVPGIIYWCLRLYNRSKYLQ